MSAHLSHTTDCSPLGQIARALLLAPLLVEEHLSPTSFLAPGASRPCPQACLSNPVLKVQAHNMDKATIKSHVVSRLSGSYTSGRNLGEQQQVLMRQEDLGSRRSYARVLHSPTSRLIFQLNCCAVFHHFALPW